MKIKCAYDKIVPIAELIPHPRNYNEHGSDQLELYTAILEEQGIRRSVTVSNLSGYITRGHGLLKTAQELGIEELPVDYQDYESEEQEIADLVADNELVRMSRINRKKRDVIVQELADKNKNLKITGLSKDKLDDILGAIKKIDFSKPTVDIKEYHEPIDEESGEPLYQEPERQMQEVKSFPIAIILDKQFFDVWQAVKGIAKVNNDSLMLKKILEKHYMEE